MMEKERGNMMEKERENTSEKDITSHSITEKASRKEAKDPKGGIRIIRIMDITTGLPSRMSPYTMPVSLKSFER